MRKLPEIEHRYGDNVHILDAPLALTLLAKLCSVETTQPQINLLVSALYRQLVASVIGDQMPTKEVAIPTRMIKYNPEAIWCGRIVDPKIKVAIVCVARAGIYPSQVCYDFLNEILEPSGVRQDHMLMNRTVNETGQVRGAAIHGAKIGGPVDGTTLLVPDPMGATGTTIKTLLEHYRDNVSGSPARTIALNLIVTPEYIRKLQQTFPKTLIYAYRLDRGLSPKEVLDSVPGEYWAQERGLNDQDYIVPGGGGFGEIMNNAFV
ncbi:MAG: uracil phosphoribosyltransferase [Pseudomonadota bacterium]